MKATGWYPHVRVDAREVAAVGSAGGVLLTQTAKSSGLDGALSEALAGWRKSLAVHHPGKVLTDLAVALALGGDCLADAGLLRSEPALFGRVGSEATISRTITALAHDADAVLAQVNSARRAARERVWSLAGEHSPLAGASAEAPLIIDLDATLLTSHSEKEQAAATFKRGFGFHPLLAFADHGTDGTGELLAFLLRPGNAGSNTAADHIALTKQALAAVPGMLQEPACWPTVAQYLENTAPIEGIATQIARHGVAPKTKGLIANDDSWVAVFPSAWKELCDDLDVDSDVACRELTARDVLMRQTSSLKPGKRNHQSTVKVGKRSVKFYKLALPLTEDEPEDELPPPPTDDDSSTIEDFDAAEQALVSAEAMAAERQAVTAPVTAQTPPVTAEVTAPETALTCEVTAVTAVTAPSSRVGAREGAHTSAREEFSFQRLGGSDEPRPNCRVCGSPTAYLVNAVPVHIGKCLVAAFGPDASRALDRAGLIPTIPASSPSTPVPPVARADAAATPTRPAARFTAPAACLDEHSLHQADGSTSPWPEVRHLGDLALLTSSDQLRLGWGGGEDRLPDLGQLWLYPSALERLGLPTDPPPLPQKALTKAQRAKESAKGYAKLDDHPMVAGAIEAGWQLGQGGHLGAWTRIWHTDLLPQGALLVALPWHRIDDVALLEGDPTPVQLAHRLRLFAEEVGVAYRITSTATGLDLIDHHRPPRRDVDDTVGSGRGRIAVLKRTAAELPPWRTKTNDGRFTNLEGDFSWWRPWESLTSSEQDTQFVHAYDRNGSYLTPWTSIELGVEDLIHHTGDDARWDGKERPGYYLIDEWDWPYWGLPNPADAAGARVAKGRMWVTVHTLRQLAAAGITPTIHEAYTWGTRTRYLDGPGKALAAARQHLQPIATGDVDAAAVLKTIKVLYTATVGKLAEREHQSDFHLWRPDWRDHVIGATRTAILANLRNIQEACGAIPVVVDRDAVLYLSDDPDPLAAWPGNQLPGKDKKLDLTALGSFKPIGTAELQQWGPQFLTKRGGRFRYDDAVKKGMTAWTEGRR